MPEPVPARVALPTAPAPRLKPPAFVARSVKPADASATTSKTFVTSYGLTLDDAVALAGLPHVTEVVLARHIPSEVRYLDRMTNARVVATVAAHADVHPLRLIAGRFLTAADNTDQENVCVLGSEVAMNLFPGEAPLDRSVTVRGQSFKVIGVLDARPGTSADRDVYMPLRTSRARFGEIVYVRESGARVATKVELSEIVVRVAGYEQLAITADAARQLLEKRHAKADWEVDW